jgi:hypothetical protein
LDGSSTQKIQFICRERLIFSRAHCFLRRCSWQHASSNQRSDQVQPVRFPTWFRRKAYPQRRLRRSLIHKKRFEYKRYGNYLRGVTAIARCAAVAVAICSWIAVTNHCAFAAAAKEIDKAQSECPFHSKPAKQKDQSSQVQCCKVLRAVVFAKTKDWARDDAKFCDTNFLVRAGCVFIARPWRAVAPLLLDTGPPGAFSFAELTLQQSLPAHAPPFVA